MVRGAGAWAAALCLAATNTSAEVIDRIAAVVGHHIILASELESQLSLYAAQQRLDLDAAGVRADLESRLLEQMVNDRLMLIQAERDTSVKVSDHEVEQELDKHLERIQSQFPAPEEFYKQLAREGLSLPELRRRYRREVRNQLLKQKLIEQRVRTVEVSAPEVDAFYQEFGDSLPTRVAAVRLLDILYSVEVSQSTLDSVRRRAETVLDSIQSGADFALMAERYSDDPSGSGGGDLGWFGRNVMVPSFERAAFGLATGEVSGVVQSPFGYHVIKSLERQGDRVHAAHILFRASPSDSDLVVAVAEVSRLRERHLSGEDFAALAKQYSADSATAVAGGDLGWIPLASLPEPFASAVGDLPAGTLLEPLTAEDGVHLIKVAERRDARPYDLALDRAEITELARRQKTGRVVDEWVARLRDEIYVEVRL
jgi:peptidyl-prolyl cis-trans isomerase SurA